jgi:hypothetical protein
MLPGIAGPGSEFQGRVLENLGAVLACHWPFRRCPAGAVVRPGTPRMPSASGVSAVRSRDRHPVTSQGAAAS